MKKVCLEFLTIIAGVLCALGVDAWYQSRVELVRAHDYEERITADLGDARDALEFELTSVERKLAAAANAAALFDRLSSAGDSAWLVMHVYNAGKDNRSAIERSTYDDLVATGGLALIASPERRQAIQTAYRTIERAELVLAPFREEYILRIRGWIPQEVILHLREVCPNISDPQPACREPAIPSDELVRIISGFGLDDARLAFQARHQALPETQAMLRNAIESVDETLGLLSGAD
jgi:hypothetical protein